MKLTALEIKQQNFEKAFRGYDPAEVKAFLNLMSNEWEHLVSRNRELEEKVKSMEEKLRHFEKVEEALHETLQTARESAEQKMEGAKKDARNTREKAEMEAESIIRDATQRRQQVRQSILRLLDRRNEIIGSIRSYLDMARDSLDQFSRDEAELFQVPSMESDDLGLKKHGDDPEKKPTSSGESASDDGSDHSDSTRPERPEGKPKSGSRSNPSGEESMDDIIDELD